MKFCIIILFILFTTFNSTSQTLRGKVIDSISKKPLELVNITYIKNDFGVNSNINGGFEIKIVDNNDVLQISSIGYKKKYLSLKEIVDSNINNIEIALVPLIEQLEEVSIINKKKTYYRSHIIGLNKKLKVRTGFPFGYEFCNYIKNAENKTGRINFVILSLNKKKDYDFLATYNIKFYEYDTLTKSPGKEIYFKNIIVQPQNKTYKLKIDVEELKIRFPKDGICVGIEILNTKYPNVNNSMSIIAPSINFTHTHLEIMTWTRYRNKTWKIGTSKSQVKDNFVNAMINLEIQIEK